MERSTGTFGSGYTKILQCNLLIKYLFPCVHCTDIEFAYDLNWD